MKIVKQQNGNVIITDDLGDVYELIQDIGTRIKSVGIGDVVSLSQNGFEVFRFATADVIATQILPAAEIPFSGTTSDLIQLLSNGFFVITTGGGGGGGEVNTASNVGTGEGVFKQKLGVDLQFKTLIAGTGVNITSAADELTIDASSVGDMLASIYDPSNLQLDVYNKANETGIEQITGSIITPPTLTATANNYNPTGFATANMIRQDVNANNRQITGFVAPALGVNRIIMINNINTASNDIRFVNNSGASIAENRLLLRDSGSRSLRPNQTAMFWYDH
ncbi:MAG: hypothetical protein GY763_06685, partial [Gammaproteobacteria bacterium]|nr:hypothetical protein [Gammaproteobacteria bacterium]